MQQLSEKEKAFVHEYLRNGYNAAAAYRKVYECKVSNAVRLLKREHVRAYIDELRTAQFESLMIDAKRVITAISELAFAERNEIANADKLKALQLLTKYLGLETSNVNVEGKVSVVQFIGEEQLDD